ncbi:MAG: hypothetical protein M3P96_13995 [Actinomycetota bacterium]|nr:hypothetical protein [Actinomycetota bacterium]
MHSTDGQLVNLALCSQVHVEDLAGDVTLVAFEPRRNGHYVLARFTRTEDAVAALEGLPGGLGAVAMSPR